LGSNNLSAKGGAAGHKPDDSAPPYIVQIAMEWSDDHLHQFRIHGKRYGIARMGGISFSDDPDSAKLTDLRLRINEHFVYEYDFTDSNLIIKMVARRNMEKALFLLFNAFDRSLRDNRCESS
jgi:hypothetical protein